MPTLIDNTMEQQMLPIGHYGYSATRMDDLGASEYTLVTIVCDVSPSVSSFTNEMEEALREIVKACKYSPRADNLLIRLVTFAGYLDEAHGFKLLERCNLDDYKRCLKIGSATARTTPLKTAYLRSPPTEGSSSRRILGQTGSSL